MSPLFTFSTQSQANAEDRVTVKGMRLDWNNLGLNPSSNTCYRVALGKSPNSLCFNGLFCKLGKVITESAMEDAVEWMFVPHAPAKKVILNPNPHVAVFADGDYKEVIKGEWGC